MQRFVLTDHAQQRMAKRRITEEDIIEVLEHHDDRLERDDGCVEYIGPARGRLLKVVLDENDEPPPVVTAHRLPGRR